jgi:parallel beta-helix repeat protein
MGRICLGVSQRVGLTLLGFGLAIGPSGILAAVSEPPPPPPPKLLRAQAEAPRVLFASPAGSDIQGSGTQDKPFRSLTFALRLATPNTVVVLLPGTYSRESGEQFPIVLKPGVTVQGDPSDHGAKVILRGGGEFLSKTDARQNVAILGVTRSRLAGVTITNPNPRGYGLWIEFASPQITDNTFTGSDHDGISITGKSDPLIRGNRFINNGANGITIYGTSAPEIRGNTFQSTGFGLNINQNATPRIDSNRIIGNRDGVIVQRSAQPILRNNMIENNERSGVAAIGNGKPNLGTIGDPGNNTFRNNGQHDIHGAASRQVIPAFGNSLTASNSTGQVDWSGGAPKQTSFVLQKSIGQPVINQPPIGQPVINPLVPVTQPIVPSSGSMPQPPAIPIQIIAPGRAFVPPSIDDRADLLSPIAPIGDLSQVLVLPVPSLPIPVGDAGDRPALQVSPEQMPWAIPGLDFNSLTQAP